MKITGRINFMMGAALLMVIAPATCPGSGEDVLQQYTSVANSELSDIRGGYVADNGMEFSFGIVKTVLINGVPMLANTLHLNLGQVDGLSASDLASKSVAQIQSGMGNSIDPGVLSGLQAGNFTFIQNAMDRAVIQNTTKIDAVINVRGLYRDLNLSSMLSQQLINAARH